jgi:crotonobetainyl-CoA:carnitine CoA-transferase CaiB-like acyl-CoA transferase
VSAADDPPLPLEGLRVLDLSSVVAGPIIARNLGDYGAEVIKVEHPRHGDAARKMGWQVPAPGDPADPPHSLWWKTLARNKLPITLDLSKPEGAALCLRLVERCDVVVESFRPGTLERWGLAPDILLEANPAVIVVRVSGFGQTGPYAQRPGFGTLAEALSGWAGLQGEEDGPPQLPAVALADEAAGVWGTMATMAALLHRERRHGGQVDGPPVSERRHGGQVDGPPVSERRHGGQVDGPPVSERRHGGQVDGPPVSERRHGGQVDGPPVSERSERRHGGQVDGPPVSERSERRHGGQVDGPPVSERRHGGQVIDVSLHEPLLSMLGPLPAVHALTGQEAPRLGNRLPFAAPRGAYRCADGLWMALSGTSPAAAHRILRAIGRPELIDDPRFATNADRLDHAEELDGLIAAWAAERTREEALAAMAAVDAAAAPVYRMGDLLADPHVQARGSVIDVPDDDLGAVAMPEISPRLSATPGRIRWTGRPMGSANTEVYRDLLGLSDDAIAALAEADVI